MAVACVASSSSSSHRQHAHTVTQATSSAILKQAVPAWTPLLRQVANTSAPYSERSSSCGTITPVKSKAPWVDQFLPIVVDGHQTIGVEKARTALVVVDMQNFFLHPDIRNNPAGLRCIEPITSCVKAFRSQGMKVIWLNWGLTDEDLLALPPSHTRLFTDKLRHQHQNQHRRSSGRRRQRRAAPAPLPGGLGSHLSEEQGRLLMKDDYNAMLYGPLRSLFLEGEAGGTDFCVYKNRMSGFWGVTTPFESFLREHDLTTLFFAGVNADQCVPGTFVDAFYRGYHCVMVKDAVSHNSAEGEATQTIIYNAGHAYGYVTSTNDILQAMA